MQVIPGDLRLALRSLGRSPGVAAVIISTLTLGIAACTVVFGIVDALLFRPYDAYREPHRLVAILEQNQQQNATGLASARNLSDWRTAARSFERMGGVAPAQVTLVGGGEPESLWAGRVTEDMFALLDARAAAGRLFAPAEYGPGGAPVAVLAHGLWARRFGARPDVVGQTLTIDGRKLTVAGVLAPTFTVKAFFGLEPQVFTPLPSEAAGDRTVRSVLVLARLKRGVTTAAARAEMQGIAARLAAAEPDNRGWSVRLIVPGEFDPAGDAQFLLVLGAAMIFVLLIVCANVANLLLALASGRTREIATRLALGASRWRIARQLVAEALLLGVAGGAGALLVAWWACRGLTWWLAGTNLAGLDLGVDARVVLFAVAVSALAALSAALIPAVRSSRRALVDALKERNAAWTRVAPGRLRSLHAAAQVGLAVVLLAGAGLVLRGVLNLRQNDPGFRADDLLTLRLTLPEGRYGRPETRSAFVDEVLARFESRHEIVSAAATMMLPAAGGLPPVQAFEIQGAAADLGRSPSAGVLSVSARYFETMGIPVEAGREFTPADRAGALPVAIVSRGFVTRWLGGGDPLGCRIHVQGDDWRTIVGIAGDVRNFHLNVAPAPAIYLPYPQRPVAAFNLVLRTRGGADPAALAPAAKAEIRAVDPQQPIGGGRSMRRVLLESLGGFDMGTLIVGVLAAVALLLAGIGLYGVLAYSVARRTREIGIRMALGADPRAIVRQVVAEGLRLIAYGGVPGLVLAAIVGRLLSSKLHRVSAVDPLVFASAILLVLFATTAASYVPARRATSVDPAVATKAE